MSSSSIPLKMKCPQCGTSQTVLRDALGRQLHCSPCQKRFRIHANGNVVEITRAKTTPDAAPVAGGRRYGWLAVAATWAVLALVGAWTFWPHSHKDIVLPPLPADLNARAELMGKAWLEKDLITMRRLTAADQGKGLRTWLSQHPSPEMEGDAARCDVRITNQKAAAARVSLRVAGTEVQQNWIRQKEQWVFVPVEGKRQASLRGKN
jgi:hypothetical protein